LSRPPELTCPRQPVFCAVVLHGLASLRLAVVLLVLLAAVLAWATLLEARNGRESAAWYVYANPWFISLLALLGANILAATLIRFPWKKHQLGFVLTHAGILVLLAGAIQTLMGGLEGQIVLQQGQRTAQFQVTARSVVNVAWHFGGRRGATDFLFSPGPADWPEQRSLDFGSSDGMGLKILRFYRHARHQTDWIADDRDFDGPALQLQLSGPGGNAIAEDWLSANMFGGEAIVGPTRHELLPLPVASMTEDFLHPPAALGKSGVLSVHYQDRMQRIEVDGNLERRIELGDEGVAVEITAYLPDAKPTPKGEFVSVSANPRNPVLELKVYLPGREQPMRQLAFARRPLLNLDAVQGETCPVRFWYHHAGLKPVPGVVFAQAPDGRLMYRAEAQGAYGPPREVQQGDRIALGGQFSVRVQQYLPRARQEVTFQPLEVAPGQADQPEAAALVEVSVDGQRRTVWLQRGDSPYSAQTILMDRGPVFLTLGYESQPLGYSLELRDVTRRFNPGRAGDAAFSSTVQLKDDAAGLDEPREISPNRPLVHGRFTLYQTGFRDPTHGKKVSILTAAYDPGRGLKYIGSAMICVGILVMFYLRAYMFRDVPALYDRRRPADDSSELPRDVTAPSNPTVSSPKMLLLAGLALGLVPATAWCGDDRAFDWDQWRCLPVQDGGRYKPLDTLAWETFRTLSNRTETTEPETGQRINAPTLYLVMLFDWQGWDASAHPHLKEPSRTAGSYFQRHQPDKWDRTPLLRVDHLALRQAIGLSKDENYIAPLVLSQAMLKLPEATVERPFVNWAEGLLRRREEGLTAFEDKALELAAKFWSYQEHRQGKRLAVLPIQGDDDQQWISLAVLMQTEWDEKSDPTGLVRQTRQQFLAARAAYFAGSAGGFNQASAGFLDAVRQLGPQLGAYPPASQIRLEVIYNRFAPFRWAWIATALAFVSISLSIGTRWRRFRVVGYVAFCAGLSAMLIGFGIRLALSGRAPVTNMYESVVYVAAGIAVFGLIFAWIYRNQFILAAAAALTTVALILADNCPAVLDAGLHPLQPVLRSNFWLVTHVLTITLSYAALALAMGIGNITLGYYLRGYIVPPEIRSLTDLTYRALQLGVLLLAAGTILGGVWADYSWGRFWGWDPKEVWALVALLAYLAVLHARFAGWIRDFGLAALAVLCFSLVMMAWYGVNFVLGAGLHSYGFGNGGAPFVAGAIMVQGLYVAAAAVRYVTSGAAAEAERAGRLAEGRALL